MVKLIKPKKLRKGDMVATVSLSWGGAGDEGLLWRYQVGKQRLEQQFGLRVKEMEHTLKGSAYLYEHPEKRAQDLMNAFADPEVKAIFTCIGGDDSVRMLPYIDFNVIRKNPKILLGYSDTTIAHLICLKAGVSSFYGPSVLAELAENHKIFDYTAEWLQKTLFDDSPIGLIDPAEEWTGEFIDWSLENALKNKTMLLNQGYEFLQGQGKVAGRLFGGCIEVLEMAKGTSLWPDPAFFDGTILFFETSEAVPEPAYLEYWLRNYGSQGILQSTKAILFGKPYQERYADEYKSSVLKILSELHLENLPVVCNASFGHNQPMCVLPYGALVQVDCDNRTVSVLESGVV